MNLGARSVKCPNCYTEFLHPGLVYVVTLEASIGAGVDRPEALNLLGEPFPCPSCPAMIKTDERYRRLSMFRNLPLLFAIPFVPLVIFGILMLPVEYASTVGWVLKAFFITPGSLCVSIAVIASRLRRRVDRWAVASMRRTCQRCGAVVAPDDADFCSACGTKLSIAVTRITINEDQTKMRSSIGKNGRMAPVGTCLVCDLEMNPFEDLASCPRCGNLFHRAHLLMWIKIRKCCPVCNERLVDREIVSHQ